MTLLVSLLMIPAILYLSFRLYNISRQFAPGNKWFKWISPLLICSFYLFPVLGLLDFYISGEIDVLNYPKILTYWFWFGLIFVFQLAGWLLIADLLKLVLNYTKSSKIVDDFYPYLILSLFVLVFCYTGWKIYRDTTQIQTREITLSVEGLPASLEGFKLAHITDIQGDEYTGEEEIADYIQKINNQNVDLIIFTGDLISYGTDFIEMSAREFGKAEAKHGSYAVVGDHDFWAGIDHVQKAFDQHDISLLQDENHTIGIDSTTNLTITGVTEVYSRASDPQVVDSLTTNTKNSAFKIFASHQVTDHIIKSAQKQHYKLLLAGHTHGGQIHVPFLGMSFSASERETDYVSGLYREGNLSISVNNGLGFTLAPIRYSAPPSVSVIELKQE